MQKQYVIFKLNNEDYGVNIEKVQEITEYKDCASIPNTPKFIVGMVNIRGSITPIISLKKRFNLESENDLKEERIIIINIKEKQVGFLVDDASQVLSIDEAQIESPPEIIMDSREDYIVGVGKVGQKLILLLDLEKLLSKEETQEIINIEV